MSAPRLNAAFYAASVEAFLAASDEEAYAPLAAPHGHTLAPEQLSAWRLQLPVLRTALADFTAHHAAEPANLAAPAPWIHLEFDIPRLGRRVDAVLVTSTAVIPIEFKVGAKKFQQLDYEQAWDYGLDLKNFHAPSHAAAIFPILCATEAPKSDRRWKPPHADGVRPPFRTNADSLGKTIDLALAEEKVSATIFTQDRATPQSATKMVADTFSRHHPQRRRCRESRGHECGGGADYRRHPRAAAEGDHLRHRRARSRQDARWLERGHASRFA